MSTRRGFLAGAGAALVGGPSALAAAPAPAGDGAAAGASSAAGAPSAVPTASTAVPAPPDLSFAAREPFLHRERATAILGAEGFDALIVGRGMNVFYATNHFPLLERMSITATSLAVVPRDPRRPVAFVVPGFSRYYVHGDDGLVPGVQAFTFTGPAPDADGDTPRAAEPPLYRVVDPALVTPREQRRRAGIVGDAPYAVDMRAALARALGDLGLAGGRLGYDDPAIEAVIAQAAPKATRVHADDTLRRVRLVRTPAEIRMMRIAAQNNVDAALATIRATREAGSLAGFRRRFYAEAALRGNLGVFMVVDGVSSDAYDEPFRDGQAFMIDAVSHCRNFHGDFGRTVFVGEPSARMRRCTEAFVKSWDEVRPRLRPGMRFSEIRALGQATLQRLGYDVPIGFGAHSVGYAHNDQPRTAPGGGPVDHVLEQDMILSVDLPLFETGNGGTAHFEDLVLITPQGGEPIHETGSPTYTV